MKTAIVILNYNGKHYLEKFLENVVRCSENANASVFIADNGSSDSSISYLEENFPRIHRILLTENYGFAGGYNKALQQIEAEYFILLNSDVEVTENWLAPIVNYMDSHPEVAACQPKIRAFNDRNHFEHAGASGGFIDKYGFPFCRGRLFTETEIDTKQYDEITEIFWATGACLFIRSKDFWEAGGLDDEFFAHMEEIDLCWRLKSRGRKIVCIPQSVVYHVGGGTLSTENPRKTYLNFRNNLLMLYKNLPPAKFKLIFFLRFFFDWAAAMQMIFTGKWKNAYKVYQAHHDFLKMKSSFKIKKDENLAATIENNPTGVYQKSIVFDFYLKGIRKFSDLNFK